MKFLKNLWSKVVVWRYTDLGLTYGDALSYSFMGECIGFKSLERKFKFWERRYVSLGYKPIEVDDWVTAGGYRGPEHISDKLLIKE